MGLIGQLLQRWLCRTSTRVSFPVPRPNGMTVSLVKHIHSQEADYYLRYQRGGSEGLAVRVPALYGEGTPTAYPGTKGPPPLPDQGRRCAGCANRIYVRDTRASSVPVAKRRYATNVRRRVSATSLPCALSVHHQVSTDVWSKRSRGFMRSTKRKIDNVMQKCKNWRDR